MRYLNCNFGSADPALIENVPDVEKRLRLQSLRTLSNNHYTLRRADFEYHRTGWPAWQVPVPRII